MDAVVINKVNECVEVYQEYGVSSGAFLQGKCISGLFDCSVPCANSIDLIFVIG